MLARFATSAVGISRSLSRALGNELAVIITPHKIKLRMVDPDNTDKNWDESMFTHGNMYLQGFANPVKPQIPDTEDDAKQSQDLELIESERYKTVMEQSLVNNIIEEGLDRSGLTKFQLMIVLMVNQIVMTGIIIYFLWA